MQETGFANEPSDLAAEIAGLVAREQERATRKAAQSAARAARAAARSAARAVPPVMDTAYSHLSLDEVRTYRLVLAREEERLGYWHRILTARLDALRGNGADVDVEHLRPALDAERLHAARASLEQVGGAPLPPLPDLEAVWVDPARKSAEKTLAVALTALTTYREAIASAVRAATHELIARYRQTPTECLSALPA